MRLMASSPSMQSPRSRATRAGWRARAGFSKASPASVSGLPCRLKVEMRLNLNHELYLRKLPLPETRMGGKTEILDLKAYDGKGIWFLSVVGTGNENIAQETVWVVDWGAGIHAHGVSEIFQWEGLGCSPWKVILPQK